jgi:hypothetical protein
MIAPQFPALEWNRINADSWCGAIAALLDGVFLTIGFSGTDDTGNL